MHVHMYICVYYVYLCVLCMYELARLIKQNIVQWTKKTYTSMCMYICVYQQNLLKIVANILKKILSNSLTY